MYRVQTQRPWYEIAERQRYLVSPDSRRDWEMTVAMRSVSAWRQRRREAARILPLQAGPRRHAGRSLTGRSSWKEASREAHRSVRRPAASEPAILSRRPQAARLHTGEQKRRCTRRSSSRSCRRRRGRASSATRRSVIGEGEPVVLSRMSLDLREIPIWGRTTAADCDEPHAATTSCDYVRARAVSRSWLVASSFTRPSGVTTTP